MSSMQGIQFHEKEHLLLKKRMLYVMRKVEILRCMNLPLQPAERDLANKLEQVVQGVTQVAGRLRDTEEMARVHAQKVDERAVVGERMRQLSEDDRNNLFKVMEEQRVGLERVVNVAKTDVRDVGIMKEELEKMGVRVR